MPYHIYKLTEPVGDDDVRYVSITEHPEVRYLQHITLRSVNEEKDTWIQGLKAKDQRPGFYVIETVDTLESGRKREDYWIRWYILQGAALTNRKLPIGAKIKQRIPERIQENPSIEIITAKEAASLLGVSYSTIFVLINNGTLQRVPMPPTIKIREPVRIYHHEIQTLLQIS